MIYIYVCVFDCMFACIPSSGAEGSCGLVVRHALGFDAFSVVVIHHLVRDFCQNTLSQCSWRGLETRRQTDREGERGGERSQIHISPATRDSRMLEFTVEPDAVKGWEQ